MSHINSERTCSIIVSLVLHLDADALNQSIYANDGQRLKEDQISGLSQSIFLAGTGLNLLRRLDPAAAQRKNHRLGTIIKRQLAQD